MKGKVIDMKILANTDKYRLIEYLGRYEVQVLNCGMWIVACWSSSVDNALNMYNLRLNENYVPKTKPFTTEDKKALWECLGFC